MIRFEDVKNSPEINSFIKAGNEVLGELGYTEHGFGHAMKCATLAGSIVEEFGGSEREAELARIAGYMHDIGNMVNRYDHAQTGAILAIDILRRMGMASEEYARIAAAIGNHDEGTGKVVSNISAALILADKATSTERASEAFSSTTIFTTESITRLPRADFTSKTRR